MKRHVGLVCSLAGALAVMAAGLSAQTAKVVFPEADGRSTVMELCGSCHDVRATVEKRRTQKDWRTSVADMRAKGASVTDDEAKVIAAYMTRYFGLVNVNTAAAEELQAVLGLSAQEARLLIAYRESHGPLATIDDLKKIEGLDGDKIEREKASLVFNGS